MHKYFFHWDKNRIFSFGPLAKKLVWFFSPTTRAIIMQMPRFPRASWTQKLNKSLLLLLSGEENYSLGRSDTPNNILGNPLFLWGRWPIFLRCLKKEFLESFEISWTQQTQWFSQKCVVKGCFPFLFQDCLSPFFVSFLLVAVFLFFPFSSGTLNLLRPSHYLHCWYLTEVSQVDTKQNKYFYIISKKVALGKRLC